VTDSASKEPPERLELRARLRPIRRLNRRMLMVSCAIGALLIAGAIIVALKPPGMFADSDKTELYNTDRKQTAEGLSKLPKSYEDLPPRLGPPAPGDLGRAFVRNEKSFIPPPASDVPFRPNPEEDAERAERIRQARIAQQAKESGLFFRLSEKQARSKHVAEATSAAASSTSTAFRPASTENRDAPTSVDLLAKAGQGLTDRSSEIVPSSQARKLAFVSAKADKETTNPHDLAAAPSAYAIMAGSIIPASLITGLNSDLPGATIAQVTENVYDTVTGEYLLIPQARGSSASTTAWWPLVRSGRSWSGPVSFFRTAIPSLSRTCRRPISRGMRVLRTKSIFIPGSCSRESG